MHAPSLPEIDTEKNTAEKFSLDESTHCKFARPFDGLCALIKLDVRPSFFLQRVPVSGRVALQKTDERRRSAHVAAGVLKLDVRSAAPLVQARNFAPATALDAAAKRT